MHRRFHLDLIRACTCLSRLRYVRNAVVPCPPFVHYTCTDLISYIHYIFSVPLKGIFKVELTSPTYYQECGKVLT